MCLHNKLVLIVQRVEMVVEDFSLEKLVSCVDQNVVSLNVAEPALFLL
jgi:hypothetical protein